MKIELELEEDPSIRMTLGHGTAEWTSKGRKIKADLRNDAGCGTYVTIDGHRYRLEPEKLIAAIAEKLGLEPGD